MKKRVFSMLMVMIMMVSMLSVSVFAATCPGDTCVASDSWNSSATEHWHYCTNGCDNKIDKAAHDANEFGSDATDHWTVCSVCGKASDAKVAHSYTVVKSDETNHWNECECGAKETAVAHADADADMKCDTCAAHVCKQVIQADAENHWYDCEDASCTLTTVSKTAHTFTQSGTTATCSVCSEAKHVHVYSKKLTSDGTYHWYACECGDASGKEEHYDHTSDYLCDECRASVPSQPLTSLTITGLTTPAEGATVDFSVNVAEARYGTPIVNWNRVTDLSKNTSVALGAGSTFAGGYLYNVGIVVPVNSLDKVSDDFKVYLDGQEVPFYSTEAAFNSAVKAYEGKYVTYMAKRGLASDNSYYCIIVCAMYPVASGTHTHSYTEDWVETPAKHYLLCTGCGETKNSEYHYDNNKSGLCDVCGYDMKYFNKNASATTTGTGTATHTHSYSTDWVEDISNHWKQCTGCGAKTQTAAHADLNNTGACDVCGFIMKAAEGHTHSFSSDWTETFAQHYKVCACGAKNEIAAHADLNNTGKCDVCGYAMTTLSNNGIVADTGDDNATFLWLGALVVAMMGFGATVLVARKKREE